MRWRTVWAIVLIFGGLAAIAGGLGWWKWRSIQAAMSQPPPEMVETIKTATVSSGSMQRSMTAVGTVRALRHVTLATEVTGVVSRVSFESGEMVEAGREIVVLDAASEEADLRAAQATASLARASLERVSKAMGAATGGAGGGGAAMSAVSEQEVDRARAERDAAEARVEQLRAMIAKKRLVTPFAGRLGLRDVHPGQYLAEGAVITSLQGQDDRVHVDFAVPQLQAVGVPVGAAVSVVVSGPGLPTREVPAEVVAVEPEIELSTRNARLRAVVPSLGGVLRPGMFVDVRVPLGEPVPVLTVPATAVRRAPFGDHVFVVEADAQNAGKLVARQRFIKSGGAGPGGVIILDGLKPGERVATDGSFKLREGMAVVEAAAATPVGPPAGQPGGPPGGEPGAGGPAASR